MRYACAVLVLLLFTACERKEVDLAALLTKVYDAHGFTAWNAITELAYVKESVVYNADGSKRLQTVQSHKYQMKPAFSAEVQWESGSDKHEIIYSEGTTQKTVNGEQITDLKVLKSAGESVNAALYTLSQPFKLSDPGVMLTYEGVDRLEEGEEVYVIKASYDTENDNHTKNDEWWYYFDVETYLCRATMVHHGTTYSYIKNLEYDHTTDVVFNYHRKGYAVDSTRKMLYHQSEYYYRNYKLGFSRN